MTRARILADYVAGGSTAAEFDVLDGLTSTTAELNYVDGVTSNVQTQLNAKAPIASPTFTGNFTSVGIDDNASGAVAITIDADEKVGIGEVTPIAKLHVKSGDSGRSVDANADELFIESAGSHCGMTIATSADTYDGYINFANSNGTSDAKILSNNGDRALQFFDGGGGFQFFTGSGTDPIKFTSAQNIECVNPEGTTTTVRLGSAWDKQGIYAGTDLHLMANSSTNKIRLIHNNSETGWFGSSSYSLPSDKRLKANVKSIENGLETVNKLRSITFNTASKEVTRLIKDADGNDIYEDYIEPEGTDLRSGLIADDIEKISELAHLVDSNEGGHCARSEKTPFKGLNYDGFIPYLIKAVQELSAKVTALENA